MKYYKLDPGNVWNPLAKGKFKNFPCPCGSDLKVKKCCGSVDYMKKDLANQINGICDLGTKEVFQGTANFNKKRREEAKITKESNEQKEDK